MGKTTRARRFFAIVTVVALVMAQGTVFTEGATSLTANNLCTHNHDGGCGYSQGTDCTHTCGESCGEGCIHAEHRADCEYTQAAPCAHKHISACGALAGGEGDGEDTP